MTRRLWVFGKTVMKVLMWGMETLALSRKQMEYLDQAHVQMVTTMLRIGRRVKAGMATTQNTISKMVHRVSQWRICICSIPCKILGMGRTHCQNESKQMGIQNNIMGMPETEIHWERSC